MEHAQIGNEAAFWKGTEKGKGKERKNGKDWFVTLLGLLLVPQGSGATSWWFHQNPWPFLDRGRGSQLINLVP